MYVCKLFGYYKSSLFTNSLGDSSYKEPKNDTKPTLQIFNPLQRNIGTFSQEREEIK